MNDKCAGSGVAVGYTAWSRHTPVITAKYWPCAHCDQMVLLMTDTVNVRLGEHTRETQ